MREQLLEIWQQSARDVIALCEPLDDEQWNSATPCPGWTVADVVAHLIDVEAMVAGDPRPDVTIDWAQFPHINNDLGRATELGVEFRRNRTKAEVLAEYQEMMARRAAELADVEGLVRSPFGNEIPIERLLGMRIFDSWVHEQDIRIALDQPGGLSSAPAQVAAQAMLGGLPKAWGKVVAPPIGSTLRVTITGPTIEADLAYVIDENGKAVPSEPGDADVHLTMTWPEYMLLATGRTTLDQTADDSDLHARTLRALNVAP